MFGPSSSLGGKYSTTSSKLRSEAIVNNREEMGAKFSVYLPQKKNEAIYTLQRKLNWQELEDQVAKLILCSSVVRVG